MSSSSLQAVVASLAESGEYHKEKPPTPILDTINYPMHMKNLSMRVSTRLTSGFSCDTAPLHLPTLHAL